MTTDVSITELARTAGLETDWTDAGGIARRVDDDALVALVDALGWPCGTAAQRGAPPRSPTRTRRPRASSPATQACRRSCRPRSRRPRALPDHARSGRACRRARGRRRRTRHAAAARDPRLPRARRRRPAHQLTIAPPRATVDPRAADAGGRWASRRSSQPAPRRRRRRGRLHRARAAGRDAARHGAQAVAISRRTPPFRRCPRTTARIRRRRGAGTTSRISTATRCRAPLPCLTQPVPRPTHR